MIRVEVKDVKVEVEVKNGRRYSYRINTNNEM